MFRRSMPSYHFHNYFQLLEKALEESGNDLDLTIKSLNEICLQYSKGNSGAAAEENAIMEKGIPLIAVTKNRHVA